MYWLEIVKYKINLMFKIYVIFFINYLRKFVLEVDINDKNIWILFLNYNIYVNVYIVIF